MLIRSLTRISNFVIFFAFTLSAPCLFAQNGRFGAPTIRDFLDLTPSEHQAFQDRFPRLNEPDFLVKGHYRTASFHATAQGKKELISITRILMDEAHSYSRYVFIGRSPAGILAFLYGVSSVVSSPFPQLSDLPYSYRARTSRPDPELIDALRDHLAINGLDPNRLAQAEKPILFIDAVSTGMTAHYLFEEIKVWAQELGIWNKVRNKIHFLGYYPARSIAENRLSELARASAKELGAAYQAPKETEIQQEMMRIRLPNILDLEQLTGKVIEYKISGEMFNYASIFGENVQDSFTPDSWALPFNRSERNSFSNRHEKDPYLETYYLMFLGREVGAMMSKALECESGLKAVSTSMPAPPLAK